MRRDVRTVSVRRGVLHVEAPLGVVNIYTGLTDRLGRPVTTIEVSPDAYAGVPRVARRGPALVRLVQLKGRRRHG